MEGSSRCGQANCILFLDENSRASNAANRPASYGCFSFALGLNCGLAVGLSCALFSRQMWAAGTLPKAIE